MDLVQVMMGNLAGILGFALLVAGVAKIYQLSTAINEIKDLLQDIKRNDRASGPVAPPLYTQSGEEMLRALGDVQEPSVQPEIIQPR